MKRLVIAVSAWLLATSVATAQIVTGSVPNTFVNGTIIDATQVNANYTYIINQINANAAKNAANNDITALTALTTPLTPAQSGSNIYYAGTATGTANTIVVASAIPSNFTLAYGKTIRFIASATNTTNVTLAVNGSAATNVFKTTPSGLALLQPGDIVGGTLTECYFDGANFELINSPQENGGFGPSYSLTNTTTADLGTSPSHHVILTVGAAINSFGSTASSTYPWYFVRAGANGISIVPGANLFTPNNAPFAMANGDWILVFWYGSGWNVVSYFPSQIKTVPAQASGLIIQNDGTTPNTVIDVTANEVVMDNSNGGNYYSSAYGTCVLNVGASGAGGLDTGAIAANTWYHIYAISTGTFDACLASTSATSPVMPSGYLFKVRLGAMVTDGASAFMRTMQRGNIAQYILTGGSNTITYRSVISGASGTCSASASTWTGTQVRGVYAPSTAVSVLASLYTANSSAGASAGPTSVPTNYLDQPMFASSASAGSAASFLFANNNLYYCSNNAGAGLRVVGWTDQVNAN